MIYLIEHNINPEFNFESDYIQIIIESPYNDCESLYKEFVLNKAKALGLTINSYWFNIMDYDKFHSHIPVDEFKKLSKEYKKWFKEWSFINFILNACEGKLIEHKKVTQVTKI